MSNKLREAWPWTMTKSEYDAIHSWIRYKYGKSDRCSNPMCKKDCNRFEWALKQGCEYKRDVNCFIKLCKRCHFKYDKQDPGCAQKHWTEDSINRIHKAKLKKIEQLDKSGEVVKIWDSLTDAASTLSINRNCISTAIIRNHSYKDFKWRHHNPFHNHQQESNF